MDVREFSWIFRNTSHHRTPLISRLDYDADGKLIYAGLAYKGSDSSDEAWIIEKYTYDANGYLSYTLISDFDVIWDNRATSVTYS